MGQSEFLIGVSGDGSPRGAHHTPCPAVAAEEPPKNGFFHKIGFFHKKMDFSTKKIDFSTKKLIFPQTEAPQKLIFPQTPTAPRDGFHTKILPLCLLCLLRGLSHSCLHSLPPQTIVGARKDRWEGGTQKCVCFWWCVQQNKHIQRKENVPEEKASYKHSGLL